MRLIILAVAAAFVLVGCTAPQGESTADKRVSVCTMHDDTLERLYERNASAKEEVESAPGYACFSNMGTMIILVSSGHGYGVVVNNKTGKKTYMRMAEAGVGIGYGIKKFRAVFVFHNERVMKDFMNSGWDLTGEADAAAKSSSEGAATGGEVSVQGVTIYQMTEAGLALTANISGTKYWKDSELN